MFQRLRGFSFPSSSLFLWLLRDSSLSLALRAFSPSRSMPFPRGGCETHRVARYVESVPRPACVGTKKPITVAWMACSRTCAAFLLELAADVRDWPIRLYQRRRQSIRRPRTLFLNVTMTTNIKHPSYMHTLTQPATTARSAVSGDSVTARTIFSFTRVFHCQKCIRFRCTTYDKSKRHMRRRTRQR